MLYRGLNDFGISSLTEGPRIGLFYPAANLGIEPYTLPIPIFNSIEFDGIKNLKSDFKML
jgi:hypothetical protein